MGDIAALVDKIRSLENAERLEKEAAEALRGKVTMRTIYHQLVSMRKMGPLTKILEMLPGASLLLPRGKLQEELRVSEKKIDKWIAIIESMTYEELDNPEIIDRRRIRRIALGSGTRPEDVRELLAYYKNVKSMMRRLRRDRRMLRRLGIDLS